MFEWLKPKSKISNFDKQLLSSNLVGAKTLDELNNKERLITEVRGIELKENPINGNLDYQHLKEIHKHLFKDIYAWAGNDRYEMGIRGDFRKGDTYFTQGNNLPTVAQVLFKALKDENNFKNLSKENFIKSTASFMNGLNTLHPFREGNGRTQRIFIEQLASRAGYKLDLTQVSSYSMIQASIHGHRGNLKGFEIILKESILSKAKKIDKDIFTLKNYKPNIKEDENQIQKERAAKKEKMQDRGMGR